MNSEKKFAYSPHRVEKIVALSDNIIVSDMSFDERLTTSGIVLLNDDMKSSGIRPRWAKVYAIGPLQKDVSVNQYVLVSHGRWTRGIDIEVDGAQKTLRKVDPNDILCVSDELLLDDTISDKAI